MSENPITEHLETAKKRLMAIEAEISRLERDRDIVRAQVEAYTISAQAMSEMKPSSKKAKRNRTPSKDWMTLGRQMAVRFPNGFGYDELEGAAKAQGMAVQRASLRTKMMNYVNDGHVERIDDGRFRVSQKGQAYFKVNDPSRSEAVAARPHTRDAATEAIHRYEMERRAREFIGENPDPRSHHPIGKSRY